MNASLNYDILETLTENLAWGNARLEAAVENVI